MNPARQHAGPRRSDGSGRSRDTANDLSHHLGRQAPFRAHRPPPTLRLQHHGGAQARGPPARRRHHRHEHGQPRWGHATAHRRQAQRGRAAARYPRLLGQQGHPAAAPRDLALVPAPLRRGDRPRQRGHRHHRLQGGPGPPDAGHAGPWRHGAGARPQLPHPHLWRGDRRGRHPRDSGVERGGLLRRAGEDHPRQLPQAQDDGVRLPVQPDGAVRGPRLLRARGGAGQEARHPGRARPGLCRHRLRRLCGPVHHAGAWRQGRGGGVLHAQQELQHGRLARRLHGRQPRPRRRAGPHQELPRLRHLHAVAGRRHRRAGGRPAMREGHRRQLPAAPRRAAQRPD
mmetsp:Transcript_2839/g.7340  ORF Transcript_2839/g.7340 Transcript_2839/m.7340 type:complete len:342 (-) Transcript_2839:1142-2167(-)